MSAGIAVSTGSAPLKARPAWAALEAHYERVRDVHLRSLFEDDPRRGERLTAEAAGLFLDYSKNRITDETLDLLLRLAEESGLRARIDAMFGGDKINLTENRAVLHVALRAPRGTLDHGRRRGRSAPGPRRARRRCPGLPTESAVARGRGTPASAFATIINIGIGGSDLGPVMAYEALRFYSDRDLTFRFVSNVDGTDLVEATRDLDPAETLFIVSSKTFTTLETMTNGAERARVAPRGARRRREGGGQALRGGLDERARRCPSSASIPPTCSGSGTGSADATPWTRRSACRRCWPSVPKTSARCSMASTRWTSTSALPRSSATCRCCWAC